LESKNYRPPHPTGMRGGCSPQNTFVIRNQGPVGLFYKNLLEHPIFVDFRNTLFGIVITIAHNQCTVKAKKRRVHSARNLKVRLNFNNFPQDKNKMNYERS